MVEVLVARTVFGLHEPAALDRLVHLLLDALHRALQRPLADVLERYVEAAQSGGVGDAAPHYPRAYNGDPSDLRARHRPT
jgi:hypothetical protein